MHMGEKKARQADVRKLVGRARRGDGRAFEALIDSCRSKILYLALHYARNADDAEDCAQEAVLKVYRGIGKLKDVDAFDSWLHSIVKYTCYRRNGTMEKNTILLGGDSGARDAIMSIEEARTEFLPAEYAEDAEKRSFIMGLIKELNENYQEALLLFYFEGFSYKEIAATLGVNANKVTNDLKRARQALRKKIEETDGRVLASAAIPAGALPTLTRIYELDCLEAVTPDMEERLTEYAATICAATVAAGAGGAAALGQGLGAKLAIGGASALLVAGIAAGVVASGDAVESAADQPAPARSVSEEPAEPPEPHLAPVPEAEPAEAPIATLADMIGAEGEAALLSLTGGAARGEVIAFAESIGAPQRGYAETLDGSTLSVYELTKQGKQLFVAAKESPETDTVEVAYRFGDAGEIPDMFEFISMFDK